MAKKKPHTMDFIKGIYNFENYDGLLFVGDPHVTAYKPEKRLDKDFLSTIIDKLNQAVDYCLKENLYMVILGDLFDDDQELNALMLTRVIQVFKRLPQPPVTIIGNHEKSETKLTNDTYTAALREAGLLHTIEKSQYWGRFKFNNEYVYLGGTPYGEPLPRNVKNLINKEYMEVLTYTIWLTHHDLQIGTYYPSCIPLHPIEGVDIVVNGHDHTAKEPVKVGNTMFFNPGNIIRMSVDKVDREPRIWKWTTEKKYELIPHTLRYEKDLFNLVGKQVIIDDPKLTAKQEQEKESKFLNLLSEIKEQTDLSIEQTTEDLEKEIKLISDTIRPENPKLHDDMVNEIIEVTKIVSKELRNGILK